MFAKIYYILNRSKIKNKLKRLENMLSEKTPWIYDNIVLYCKAELKKRCFKCRKNLYMQEQLLWDFAGDENYQPLVSVIVPNYNHEPYLAERLESIYAQTYKNIEVILLDDCSTDNSKEILEKYQARYPEITSLYVNRENGKKVFAQWKKGIKLAKGQLIWIAESDDHCDADFLSELVGAFSNEAVMLAFCRSSFRKNGREIEFTEHYLGEFTDFDWSKSFFVSAHDLVQRAFAFKNIIPNVSSVVFRKTGQISSQLEALWSEMKLCGDWVFYLEKIQGGLVYYSSAATNYYRIHDNSTSLKIQKTARYYKEQQMVSEYLAEHYNVPFSCFEQQKKKLTEHYLYFNPDKKPEDIDDWYKPDKIRQIKRTPAVLMCGFSMSIGGGETFPIFLANELKNQGLTVTYLDFQLAENEEKVRKLLSPAIPLFKLDDKNMLGKILFRFGADVIHSHHASVDEIITHFSGLNPECRHVVTLHGMYETLSSYDLKRILPEVDKSCSCFVYIAEKNLVPFKNTGYFKPDKMFRIDNGLPETDIKPISRQELGIDDQAFVLCLVSRAIPEKGWQEACEAVRLAREKSGLDIQLLLLGSGEMYDRLQKEKCDFIHLLGFKSNTRDYFAAADMGFLPSRFPGESFPLVIIDCFFCQRPVIASNIGEIAYQLFDEEKNCAGALFDLEDGAVPISRVADIIIRFAERGQEYQKACETAAKQAEKFSIARTAEKYRFIYAKAAHKG
ncbi:MAG: glycosyltransferase [bacterium]